jgi:23S rRNA (adenine2030-N6)-methyltransferase
LPVRRPGLTASGVFVVNPPHTLKPMLLAAMPQLLALLSRGSGAAQTVTSG